MAVEELKLQTLRRVITENLRVQRGGGADIKYVDVTHALADASARQNHAIFARRGCGKTLLLHVSSIQLDERVRTVYLNCEDFKRHSFPNVLIEILDALFGELERHLNAWFGRKKRLRQLIETIRRDLAGLRVAPDTRDETVKTTAASSSASGAKVGLKAGTESATADLTIGTEAAVREETERTFNVHREKIRQLDILLPRLKQQIREFFELSASTEAVFLQVDDLYHLPRADQPFVVDYLHRLCKDVPLYFKIATLRHASTLYVDRHGQPIGAQERHDYQPINIDYTFSDFAKTRTQNRQILLEYARLADLSAAELDSLFKGEGFDRLVMAGGGVPRDVLSLFLEILGTVQVSGDGRIGKDDVRILSRENFQRRIEELKQDSEGEVQDSLMRGIYVLREFCLEKQTNVFVVSERLLQQNDAVRTLINRLLDYRIIHVVGSALTHKSAHGTTYQAFAIDIGCYAHLRKLDGRFNEVDVSARDVKERARSAPIFDLDEFNARFGDAPRNIEDALLADGEAA
jgi:hypothetical protein